VVNFCACSAFGLEYVPARETLRIYLGRMARKVKGIIAMLKRAAYNFKRMHKLMKGQMSLTLAVVAGN